MPGPVPLGQLRDLTHSGTHSACGQCPWNPKLEAMAFGWSCSRHGFHEGRSGSAVSLQIVQDPGGTTPEKTGVLCFVCNSRNSTDRTARNNFDLWRAAVAGSWDGDDLPDPDYYSDPFLEHHFWINSVSHGANPKLDRRKHLHDARHYCESVVESFLDTLQPAVVIASGGMARTTIEALGFLPDRSTRNTSVSRPSRYQRSVLGSRRTVAFCTHHTSATAVNTGASRFHSEPETVTLVRERAREFGVETAVEGFLAKYSRKEHSGHKGMRVLLLDWLEIGQMVRLARDVA